MVIRGEKRQTCINGINTEYKPSCAESLPVLLSTAATSTPSLSSESLFSKNRQKLKRNVSFNFKTSTKLKTQITHRHLKDRLNVYARLHQQQVPRGRRRLCSLTLEQNRRRIVGFNRKSRLGEDGEKRANRPREAKRQTE